MKKTILDFSNCKTYMDFHSILKETFSFPDYYGANLDALWDCLCDYLEPDTIIEIKGFNSLPAEFKKYLPDIIEVFNDIIKTVPNTKFKIIS